MHAIEPHFQWRNLYVASEDERSPFFGREYSEFEFTHAIYDHVIHPQWDAIGSPTLFIKILYTDYETGYAIIEMIGEWNDCLHNDIMHFKRNVIDELVYEGINKFILIGESVLIFHSSDDSYYQEWSEDLEDGWILMMNFLPHVKKEIIEAGIGQYTFTDDKFDDISWRTFNPMTLCQYLEEMMSKRLMKDARH